jgi:LuxR family maltose regulon positive regulatory protein
MGTGPTARRPQPRSPGHVETTAGDVLAGTGTPDLPRHLVTRSRLLDLMEEGVQGSLTLVSAPAGTGKTVLVSTWARTATAGFAVVWLSTTPDGGAEEVWPRLPDALRRSGVQVAGLGLPSDANEPSEAWLSRLAATTAAHPVPVVLVLDEGKRAHPAVHRSLATLMQSAGSSLRVVLLTRSDPVLPLNRYRVDHQLTEIRAGDLSFDEEEAGSLFELAGISLTPAQTKTLVGRTSGWAVGLRLAAMALEGKADVGTAVNDFGGAQDNVSTYLATQVLHGQPPLLREVLLRTSIVDALSPGLFEVLTGVDDGQRAMGFMARGNSFMEAVPDHPGWYRYQSLFRDFLRAQLAFEEPDLVSELHRKAAAWFAHNGFLTMAVRHAATEGAWDDAARYLVEDLSIGSLVTAIWASGDTSVFADLPRCEEGTAASIVRAALALGAGDQAACGDELARARALLGADPENSASCAFSITLLETLCAVVRADVEGGLALAHRAEQQLRGNFPEAGRTRPELAMLLALARARLCLWKGDLISAAAALEGLSADDATRTTAQLRVVSLGLRGLIDAISGRSSEAVQHADEAEDLARAAGADVATWSWEVPAARAWLLVGEMDPVAAAEHVRRAEAGASANGDLTSPMNVGLLALVRSHVLWAEGQPEAARDVLTQLDLRVAQSLLAAAEPLHRLPAKESAGADPRVYVVSPVGSPVRTMEGTDGPHDSELLIEQLTWRELEVLGHLAELLTTEEIAATMFISVNTVRTHVRNILRKLAVARRNDAVRRAWELGLLPPGAGA